MLLCQICLNRQFTSKELNKYIKIKMISNDIFVIAFADQ